MFKYYLKNKKDVYAFEADGSQDAYIPDDMVEMTEDEIDRHLNPQKYMSDEEKRSLYLASLRPLTRRQFKLGLLEAGLLDEIENCITSIEDSTMRSRIQIEYTESEKFHRTSDTVIYMMCELLGLTENQVNQIWEHALTL